MRKLPFAEIPLKPLEKPFPDGTYVIVQYKGTMQRSPHYGMIPQPFPWWAGVQIFSGGLSDLGMSGGSVADILNKTKDIAKVYLVEGIHTDKREELTRELAKANIELIPEQVAA
jgi:hypothetical protein